MRHVPVPRGNSHRSGRRDRAIIFSGTFSLGRHGSAGTGSIRLRLESVVPFATGEAFCAFKLFLASKSW